MDLFIAALIITLVACHTPQLAPGGAYSGSTLATNATTGSVSTNTTGVADPALFVADSAYKLAYDAIDGVLLFELNNRALLKTSFPGIKPALDNIRPTLVDIDRRWSAARKVYKSLPTPANLSTLQGILAEIQDIVPIAQAAMAPALTLTPTNSVPTP